MELLFPLGESDTTELSGEKSLQSLGQTTVQQ